MELFDKIKNFIAHLETKQFYRYSGIILGSLIVLMLTIIYYHYSSMKFWAKRINIINEEREEIRSILDKAQLVANQRAEVDSMLNESPDFKIDGYFTELVSKFGFAGNTKPTTSISFGDRDDMQYREVFLNAKFDTMTMKQLCELLDEIEQKDRIYIKELEIVKSKKIPDTIMVNLTIATLQRKPEQTEITE